ncbi:ribokinase [Paucibacter oligotrophus]|uniref:Ribokinase n=1 Tax=Roseateles oligotrophus TaxID=1769250 RepID=A0A840LD95_9BURK|nr:ribokinase [Roseateles oligotrophus]MBB4844039.1 ribokinase [Roseateles oligotrophus]
MTQQNSGLSDSTALPAQVLVVGSINMDMVAHAPRLPAAGETLVGEAFVMAPGGKGANQAVAAARLGASVAFVSRVGTRQHGEALLQALQDEGVDGSAVLRDAQALPGIAVIMVASEGGENSIVYVPGSNAQLSPQDVLAGARKFQAGTVTVAQLEVPLPAVQQAFELSRAAGGRTVLNAAPALAVTPALLALTDWLVLNETEAFQLAGLPALPEETPPAQLLSQVGVAAQALRQRGAGQVLVTLGGTGVLMCGAEGLQHLPAQAVKAVDTVGAGDTFVGGFATGLAEGLSAVDAVRLGMAAAAIAVSRSGVQSAMPRRAELGPAFAPRQD